MFEIETAKQGEKVIVVHPTLLTNEVEGKSAREPEAALEEAIGLAAAINLEVVHSRNINLKSVIPATLIGTGSVKELKEIAETEGAKLLFVDHALTPIQQRNLERALDCKVIDRTGLILEIFGARAKTKEGSLQVELAALEYQRSRLVRAWTHLERQRGGGGFTGGPGETQKELDRRMIDDRIRRLKRDLESIRKARELQREARKKEPFPVVAIVGYTNAGKSTLFNHITNSKVFAKDLLFATLDTTMRGIKLPSGKKAILSDTVGFISDLPTHLVAAFRATLEDVQDAAVILHVRDISQEDTEAERADVNAILEDLGIDSENDERIIEVLNKTDQIDEDEKQALLRRSERQEGVVPVSAIKGEGVKLLLEAIDAVLCKRQKTVGVDVDITDGKAIAWLYDRGQVYERHDDEEKAHITIGLDPANIDRFTHSFPYKIEGVE